MKDTTSDMPEQHKSQGAPNGSVDCGDCCSEQLPVATGASPVRMRHNKPEGGSLVTSAVRMTPPEPDAAMNAERVKCFTRSGADRLPYPGMSDRDWNSKDQKAPNMEKN